MNAEELFTRCEECFGVTGVRCEATRMAGRTGQTALEAQRLDEDLRAGAQRQLIEKVSNSVLALGCRLGRETLKAQLLYEPDAQ